MRIHAKLTDVRMTPFTDRIHAQLTDVRCDVDAESSDGVFTRILKQLCHQQVIILHPHREFFHVCEHTTSQSRQTGDKSVPPNRIYTQQHNQASQGSCLWEGEDVFVLCMHREKGFLPWWCFLARCAAAIFCVCVLCACDTLHPVIHMLKYGDGVVYLVSAW